MPNPLSLMRRSLSNPAWFKADVTRRALTANGAKETKEAEKLVDLMRRLDSHTEEVSPEIYFQLRRELMRPEPEPLTGEQLRLPGFKDGGSTNEKLAREMSHRQSSSQMDPRLERYLATNERINPEQGLEAPFIDPTMPTFLGGLVPKGIADMLAQGAKGYSKAAAEAIARGVEGGSPLTALARPAYVFHSDIPLDTGEITPLFLNPSDSELARLMNLSRRTADVEGGQAAVRLLRDLQNTNTYAADGNKVLHSDMVGHLNLNPDKTKTDIWFPEEPRERALNFLNSLPMEKCNGGLVSLRSKK